MKDVLSFLWSLLYNNNSILQVRKIKLEKSIEALNKKLEKLDLEKLKITRQMKETAQKIKIKERGKEIILTYLFNYSKTISNLRSIIHEVDKNMKNLMKLRMKWWEIINKKKWII